MAADAPDLTTKGNHRPGQEDLPADAAEIHPDDEQHGADSLDNMPVLSRDTPEELLQWLSLSLNQLRRRSGRMGQNVSIVEKLLSSLKGLRLVGYGMVALVILDFASLLLDAQVMNPGWEWGFFGATVERSAVLLLGVALVLLGHENLRGNVERYFLQAVYWGSLVAGLAYLLMLPLSLANSYRLHDFYQQQYDSTYNSVERQYRDIVASINAVQPPLVTQPGAVDEQEQASRNAAAKQAAREAIQLKLQAEQRLADNNAVLRRQSLSWLGGGLLVGIIFLVLWHQARWVKGCTPKKVIRPLLKKHSRRNKAPAEQYARMQRSRPKATTGSAPTPSTTPGPGAQPGLKPAIRRKHSRTKTE